MKRIKGREIAAKQVDKVVLLPEVTYKLQEGIDPSELYTKDSPLGAGTFGTVYKAFSPNSKKPLALKTIKENPDVEIKLIIHCKSPFVINFHAAYSFDNKFFIILEACDIGSVHDIIHMAKTRISEDCLRDIMTMSILALSFLQEMRVLHRDIKSGNILVDQSGHIKLCDFGVSIYMPEEDRTRTVIGSPYWMAPEVAMPEEEGYTFNADVWSVGITAIEMRQGAPPHLRHKLKPIHLFILMQTTDPPKLEKPEEVSEECNEFIASCLTKLSTGVRPFAEELKTHEFIRDRVEFFEQSDRNEGSEFLRQLVDENLSKIHEFRSKTTFVDEDDIEEDESDGETFIKIGNRRQQSFKTISSDGDFDSIVVRESVYRRASVKAQSFVDLSHKRSAVGFVLNLEEDSLENGKVEPQDVEEGSFSFDVDDPLIQRLRGNISKMKKDFHEDVRGYLKQNNVNMKHVKRRVKHAKTDLDNIL